MTKVQQPKNNMFNKSYVVGAISIDFFDKRD